MGSGLPGINLVPIFFSKPYPSQPPHSQVLPFFAFRPKWLEWSVSNWAVAEDAFICSRGLMFRGQKGAIYR